MLNDIQPFPVVRLEIEGMKHAIQIAFSEYMVKLDSDVQKAIEIQCTPENITEIINKYAQDAIHEFIRTELQSFFRCGEGAKVIKQAIKDGIEKHIKD